MRSGLVLASNGCRCCMRPSPQPIRAPENDAAAHARSAVHFAHLGRNVRCPGQSRTTPPHNPDLAAWGPPVSIVLHRPALLANLRHARKAPASRVSLRKCVVLDDDDASQAFAEVASECVPVCHQTSYQYQPLNLGVLSHCTNPMVARAALVVGDFLRRVVARALAQQFASPLAVACRPHQNALGSRVGPEARIHEVQARCAQNSHLTEAAWTAARLGIFLPPSLGGPGLFAAERVAPAAYWAAWPGALPVLRQRFPDVACDPRGYLIDAAASAGSCSWRKRQAKPAQTRHGRARAEVAVASRFPRAGSAKRVGQLMISGGWLYSSSAIVGRAVGLVVARASAQLDPVQPPLRTRRTFVSSAAW